MCLSGSPPNPPHQGRRTSTPVGIFVEIRTMQSSPDLSPRVVEVTDNVTETLSTEDSVEMGARELIDLRFASLNAIDEDVDTDTFVYGANPENLTNSGANDDAEFEEHDEGEARVGVEGRDRMWNPFRKLAGGGFDFVVRKGRNKRIVEPGSEESFNQILAGKTNMGILKLLEIHGGVRVFIGPRLDEPRDILIGDSRWNM
jgi:hypothetical protein